MAATVTAAHLRAQRARSATGASTHVRRLYLVLAAWAAVGLTIAARVDRRRD